MGYILSDLYSISSNDHHEYFIFLVGEHGLDERSRWIIQNFDTIATALQGKSVIVRGILPHFTSDVLYRYQSNIETFLLEDNQARWQFHDSLRRYISDLLIHSTRFGWSIYPLLIVTNQNPNVPMSEQKDVVFYLVPIGELSSVLEAEELVLAIVQGTQLDDFTRLEQLLAERFPRSVSQNAIEIINQTVELRPNFFGLGINLNRLIQLFIQQRRSNSHNASSNP